MLYMVVQPIIILAQFALGVVFFIPKYAEQLNEIAKNDSGCSNATVVGQVTVKYTYTPLHAIHLRQVEAGGQTTPFFFCVCLCMAFDHGSYILAVAPEREHMGY